MNKDISKKYSKQLEFFQSQIPLGTQRSVVPYATVEHYHEIVSEIERVSGEDLSRFRIPNSVIWNEGETYSTDGFRDRLGSLIGYLKANIEEEKEEGSADTLKIITGIQRSLRKLFRTKPVSEKEVQEKIEITAVRKAIAFHRPILLMNPFMPYSV